MAKPTNKMLIETLCIAQSRIAASDVDVHRKKSDIDNLQYLIRELVGKEILEEAKKPVCGTCHGQGQVPNWKDWDDYHGEPRPKPCPDCDTKTWAQKMKEKNGEV